jgi:hypothetical protein
LQKKTVFLQKIREYMAKNAKWSDDYWLLLMQIYLQKPVGIKPTFHRKMVDLSLELHMPPNFLFNKMCQIANLETPRIEHIWETYGRNPKKLARAVSLWREMRGYGHADAFYEGVEVQETFERDFKPVNKDTTMTPVMMTLILDLYFRLTPVTMVPETPEVQELAKLIKVRPQEVIEIMKLFQYCDPYLNRKDQPDSTLLAPCQEIWRRYGNAETEQLAAYAEQLKEYFRS